MKRVAVQSIVVVSLGLAAALVAYAMPAGSPTANADVPRAVAPATQPAEQATPLPPSRPFPAEYRILFKRSMFARHSPPEKMEGSGPPVAAPSELRDFALRGVASQEGGFVAFVENTPKSSILLLHRGDALSRGKVGQISLGGIEYEDAGQVTHVAIGCRLDGTPPDAAADSSDGGEQKASKKIKPSSDANGEKPAGERKEKER